MPWIKLDDQWMDHPKIIRAGRDARDMWLASITWCAKHLTDGLFPIELLPALAVMAGIDVANCQKFAKTLLDLCLWDATETGYMVHDYLDYNPTKEQTELNRTARSEAGKAGGLAKASKMSSKTLAKSWQNPGKTLAKSWQKSAPSPSPSPSPNPVPAPEPEEEADGDKNFSLIPLSNAFVEASGLPECAGGAQSYYTALQEMKTAGVTPEDLVIAIQELREKNYTIVRPKSCVVAAINVMGKRNGKKPGPDPDSKEARSKYYSGEMADYVEH